MRSNNLIFLILLIQVFVCACSDKAPGCSTLSWGETKVEEPGFDLKYSAGDQCGNINDYYDIDIEEIISNIQSMKFKITRCINADTDETAQCPELVPETIEFGEVVSCSFSTPPAENTKCSIGPLGISFSSDTYFERISWEFDVESPDDPAEIYSYKNDKSMNSMDVSFSDKKEFIYFSWKETSDQGVEEVKKIHAEYSVETK